MPNRHLSPLRGKNCRVNWILGSRSPRRLELLKAFDPTGEIQVLPPLSADEAGFDGLTQWAEISEQVLSIARAKFLDVVGQVEKLGLYPKAIVCADTTVVCETSPEKWLAIGQPPVNDPDHQVLRTWLGRYLALRTHRVITACCLRTETGQVHEGTAVTQVTFRPDVADWLDWYVSLNESQGKAGGYAIQGVGSVLVERIEGSLSNVVGLPLELLAEWTGCCRK
ncbi:MAG: hypothetical protein C0478_14295 [Planctomyces sp.]|nr:hypothetical protein [Planctomyces sp.]